MNLLSNQRDIVNAVSSRRNCQIDIMHWQDKLTYYQLERALLIIWDNLMVSGKGSSGDATLLPGLALDLYYGSDLIGTGRIDKYIRPQSGGYGQVPNSTLSVAIAM